MNDMREFNIGDVCHIREWGDMVKEYGHDSNGSIPLPGKFTFPPSMRNLCGKPFTITGKYSKTDGEHRQYYSSKEGTEKTSFGWNWVITGDMLELDTPKSSYVYNKGYEAGLNAAWEAAREIVAFDGLGVDGLMDCFGDNTFRNGILNYSASEAIDKIRKYKEAQKAEQEIKVGDEVETISSEGSGTRFFVTNLNEARVFGTDKDGKWVGCYKKEARKTGRHFSEIENVLNAMKGG